MLRILIGTFLILLISSCEEEKNVITSNSNVSNPLFPIDSIYGNYESVAYKTFNTGGGTGGYFVTFIDEKRFKTFWFCDICDGAGRIGSYT